MDPALSNQNENLPINEHAAKKKEKKTYKAQPNKISELPPDMASHQKSMTK